MIIRVDITEDNAAVNYYDPVVTTPGGSEEPGVNENPDNNEEPDNTDADFTLPPLRVEMRKAIPDGYASHRTEYPVTLINVTVPDDDVKVVTGWFSNAPNTGGVASETLLKRATTAVTGAIKTFYNDCDRAGIFTRPFKLGYALRLSDGRHIAHGDIQTVVPAAQAPLLPITSKGLSNGILQTVTEFLLTPVELYVSMEPFALPEGLSAKVTHLDIYATRQADTLTGEESVTGVNTFVTDDVRYTGWNYRRLGADIVTDNAASDKNLRIPASIPIAEAAAGLSGVRFPYTQRNLMNWTNYEAYKANESGGQGSGGGGSTSGQDPEEPEIVYKSKKLITEPLDLNLPEMRKWVRGLAVRGVFDRRFPRVSESGETASGQPVSGESLRELKVTLYGAHHRGYWHRVAECRGPHIRLMRAVGYRWWMVEIEAAADALIDALTFDVTY